MASASLSNRSALRCTLSVRSSNLTASHSQPNSTGKTSASNKFDRYQSPALKSNQAGITAKQSSTQGVPITTSHTQQVMSSSMQNTSTSAGRLMQAAVGNTQTAASASLKINSKGSKQMSQFRYGPVRAV